MMTSVTWLLALVACGARHPPPAAAVTAVVAAVPIVAPQPAPLDQQDQRCAGILQDLVEAAQELERGLADAEVAFEVLCEAIQSEHGPETLAAIESEIEASHAQYIASLVEDGQDERPAADDHGCGTDVRDAHARVLDLQVAMADAEAAQRHLEALEP